ncbi:MAG: glycosyltransferase [Nitrospirota bacterium]
MDKMNIMHLTFSLDVGGLENVVLNLSKKIDKNRYCQRVCSLTSRTAMAAEFEQCGIPVHRLNKRDGLDPFLPSRLSRLLQEHQVHILHTHNPGPFFYGFLGAKLSETTKLVHTEHSSLPRNYRLMSKIISFFSRGFEKIISDSHSVTEHMIVVQGLPAEKIATIYNGIDTDLYATALRDEALLSEFGIPMGSKIIGAVGRLESEKNHATLLSAFQKVSRIIPNAYLVIVGDGTLRDQLTAQARSLHIDTHVVFLGSRRDVYRLLPLFDLFVLPSKSEGLPLAILEAMAAKIPIVATRVGGIPEIIRDQETGWLVPPEDSAAMGEGIVALLLDRKRANSFSEAAFKVVVSRFSIQAMVSQYEVIYEEAFKKK